MAIRIIVTTALLIFLSARNESFAQAMHERNGHLWNSLIITSIQNPALAGLEHKHHIYFDYGRPWYAGVDDDFKRHHDQAGYDLILKTFKEKFKLGMGAYYSGSFLAHTSEQSLGLVNSFAVIFENESELSLGISVLAMNIRKIDYADLSFGHNFDGVGFNPMLPNGEAFQEERLVNYGPLNVGAWYKTKSYFVGFSALNLTRPNTSYYDDPDERSDVALYANFGLIMKTKSSLLIMPSLEYRNDALMFNSFHPRLTFSFSKNRFIAGTYYENDAMYVLAGFDLFNHWLLSVDAGWFVHKDVDTGMQGFKVKSRMHF